jgi:hypothetical protein
LEISLSASKKHGISKGAKKSERAVMGTLAYRFLSSLKKKVLVLEEILYCLIGNHLLIEDVSTGLGALYHFDNFCVCATVRFTFLEGSNRFLCHVS